MDINITPMISFNPYSTGLSILSLLPYYFMINGLKRNEYIGIKKFGKKRTTEYLKRNIESIIQENDNILSEVLNYKDIFFLNNINL